MSKESLLESIGTEGFFRSQKSVMIRDLKYHLNVFNGYYKSAFLKLKSIP